MLVASSGTKALESCSSSPLTPPRILTRVVSARLGARPATSGRATTRREVARTDSSQKISKSKKGTVLITSCDQGPDV